MVAVVGLAQTVAEGVPAAVVSADTLIDATPVDYLILATYFVFVLGIGLIARRSVSDSLDFFLSGRLAARLGDRPGVHLGQPRGRRDHGHVGQRRPDRHRDGALLLDRRHPRDALPRRRDDAVLLRLEGALGPRVHVPAVRHQGAPGQRDLVRGGPAAHRRRQPLPARLDRARAARLAAVAGPHRRRGHRAVLHHPRRPVRGDLQRGAAVLRHRRLAAAARHHRPEPGRWLERPRGEDHHRGEHAPRRRPRCRRPPTS